MAPGGGVTVAVTDHAVERFRQRVGTRVGGLDIRPEIAGRVSEAWSAGLVVTPWEDARYGRPRVDQRFTDALKESDPALVDPGRRWRERRDR